jgi:hypothetical protein
MISRYWVSVPDEAFVRWFWLCLRNVMFFFDALGLLNLALFL